MVQKTDESEVKILKISIKIKNFAEKFRIICFGSGNTFLVKRILKIQKFRNQKFIPMGKNFEQNRAEIVLKTDET